MENKMKLTIAILLLSIKSFAIDCPSPKSIDPSDKRFYTTEDKKLRACYIMCSDTSVDAWESGYCGRDCKTHCTSEAEAKNLKACYADCSETSVDAWEMAYCGLNCDEKYKSESSF